MTADPAGAIWAQACEEVPVQAVPDADWYARMDWIDRQGQAAAHRALCFRLMEQLLRIARRDRRAVVTVAAMLLEELGAGMVERSLFGDGLREDAEHWAHFAEPLELEAVVVAGVRALDRAVIARKARKRLVATLWRDMDPADRADFLARVDPGGKRRGA